jgi:hypothetical protein
VFSQKFDECHDARRQSRRSVGLVARDEGAYFGQASEGAPRPDNL